MPLRSWSGLNERRSACEPSAEGEAAAARAEIERIREELELAGANKAEANEIIARAEEFESQLAQRRQELEAQTVEQAKAVEAREEAVRLRDAEIADREGELERFRAELAGELDRRNEEVAALRLEIERRAETGGHPGDDG